MDFILKDGDVLLENGFQRCDLLIREGKILQIGEKLTAGYVSEIDCRGCYLLPGIIDMHVHTGEAVNNISLAEDEELTVRSCLQGGVTTIGAFITETVKDRLPEAYQTRNERFEPYPINVNWHLTPVISSPDSLEELFRLGCSMKLYTTYRSAGLYSSYAEIGEMLNILSSISRSLNRPHIPLLIHCEDDRTVEEKSDSIPFKTPFDHARRRPETAEIRAVERVLGLALDNNYPVHIVHVSSPETALLIREAKKSLPVTCETAPHYLLLNEKRLQEKDGHRWLCTPPLRSERSRGLMLELAQDGIFDTFATDHCPFSKSDKDRYAEEPIKIPLGLAGTGALLPILYEKLVESGKLSFEKLLERITVNPAKIMQLYPKKGVIRTDSDADLLVLETGEKPSESIKPSLASVYNQWAGENSSLNIRDIYLQGKKLARESWPEKV
jgi:dihydropyrimidinase